MIDLRPVLSDRALLRRRLIMAEILARRGQGPLALGSYVSAHQPGRRPRAMRETSNPPSTQRNSDG